MDFRSNGSLAAKAPTVGQGIVSQNPPSMVQPTTTTDFAATAIGQAEQSRLTRALDQALSSLNRTPGTITLLKHKHPVPSRMIHGGGIGKFTGKVPDTGRYRNEWSFMLVPANTQVLAFRGRNYTDSYRWFGPGNHNLHAAGVRWHDRGAPESLITLPVVPDVDSIIQQTLNLATPTYGRLINQSNFQSHPIVLKVKQYLYKWAGMLAGKPQQEAYRKYTTFLQNLAAKVRAAGPVQPTQQCRSGFKVWTPAAGQGPQNGPWNNYPPAQYEVYPLPGTASYCYQIKAAQKPQGFVCPTGVYKEYSSGAKVCVPRDLMGCEAQGGQLRMSGRPDRKRGWPYTVYCYFPGRSAVISRHRWTAGGPVIVDDFPLKQTTGGYVIDEDALGVEIDETVGQFGGFAGIQSPHSLEQLKAMHDARMGGAPPTSTPMPTDLPAPAMTSPMTPPAPEDTIPSLPEEIPPSPDSVPLPGELTDQGEGGMYFPSAQDRQAMDVLADLRDGMQSLRRDSRQFGTTFKKEFEELDGFTPELSTKLGDLRQAARGIQSLSNQFLTGEFEPVNTDDASLAAALLTSGAPLKFGGGTLQAVRRP